MKYNWEIKDLQKERKKIIELIRATNDMKRKIFLQNCLADLDDSIFSMTIKKNIKQSVDQNMLMHISDYLSYPREYKLSTKFYSYCATKDQQMDEIDLSLISKFGEDIEIAKATGAYISEDQALSIMDSFFKQLDSELYKTFCEVFKDRFQYLRFRPSVEDDGKTLFVYGTRKNYITVQNSKEGKKLFSLIHEYAHAIHNLLLPENSYESIGCNYVEVPSIFLELVALYENPAQFNPIYIAYLNYITLTTYVDCSFQLQMQEPIINLWRSCNCKTNKYFFDLLEERCDINRDEFKEIMNCSINEEGIYVVSYYVALKLLAIYKKDKKRALELYKEFLILPTNLDVSVFVENLIKDDKDVKKEINGIINGMSLSLKKDGGNNV